MFIAFENKDRYGSSLFSLTLYFALIFIESHRPEGSIQIKFKKKSALDQKLVWSNVLPDFPC